MAKKFDVKDIVNKYSNMKSSSDGNKFLKLDKGDTTIRLVLFTDSSTERECLYMEYTQNFVNQLKKGFVNPQSIGGERSPFSMYAEYLAKTEGENDVSNKMRDKKRYLFNVIHEGELKLMECGAQLAQSLFSIFANDDYGNVADLKTGREIKVTKTGSGLDTEYTALPRPKVSPVDVSILKDKPPVDLVSYVYNKVVDHDEMVNELEKAFNVDFNDVKEFFEGGSKNKKNNKNVEEEEDEFEGMSQKELLALAKKKQKEEGYDDAPNPKWDAEKLKCYIKSGLPF